MAGTSAKKRVNGVFVPNMPKQLTPLDTSELTLVNNANFEQVTIAQADVTGQTAFRLHFAEVSFTQLIAAETHFEQMRLEDIRVAGGNLANASWSKISCYRTEFLDCRMTGMSFLDGTLHDIRFKNCKGDFMQFYRATLRDARFEECPLNGADFRDADLGGVVFTRCDLTNADFTGATLRDSDLRGCPIEGMRAGPKELHGAIIDETQALALVRGMGITIS